MTYSHDFSNKVINTREKKNLSITKVAKRFGVGLASVLRRSKNLKAKTKRNKPDTKIDMDALRHDVEQHSDAYQSERATRLDVSESCMLSSV